MKDLQALPNTNIDGKSKQLSGNVQRFTFDLPLSASIIINMLFVKYSELYIILPAFVGH